MKNSPLKLGVGYRQQALLTIHPQPNDIPMDMIHNGGGSHGIVFKGAAAKMSKEIDLLEPVGRALYPSVSRSQVAAANEFRLAWLFQPLLGTRTPYGRTGSNPVQEGYEPGPPAQIDVVNFRPVEDGVGISISD